MEEIKNIVAKNICELRKKNNMTQLELAEKLNYSDKAVSKWEKGENSPDIAVLARMSKIFGVSLDYFIETEHEKPQIEQSAPKENKYNRRVISYIAESVAWIVAIFAFIITTLILKKVSFQFLYFVYTLPIALIVKLIFNSIWFNPRNNYFIISALMWAILTAVHITFLYFNVNVFLIYLLGLSGQVVIILWSRINRAKK